MLEYAQIDAKMAKHIAIAKSIEARKARVAVLAAQKAAKTNSTAAKASNPFDKFGASLATGYDNYYAAQYAKAAVTSKQLAERSVQNALKIAERKKKAMAGTYAGAAAAATASDAVMATTNSSNVAGYVSKTVANLAKAQRAAERTAAAARNLTTTAGSGAAGPATARIVANATAAGGWEGRLNLQVDQVIAPYLARLVTPAAPAAAGR